MDVKIFTDNIEEQAKEQINTLVSLEPFKDCKIRIMPDVHAGAGCVIGFTADLGDKVIPNIVGVDIGCGMLTVTFTDKDIDFKKLDRCIKQNIPSGFSVHNELSKYDDIDELLCYPNLNNYERLYRSLGTLGGGNHFIEVDYNEETGLHYLVIHTGSRNIGLQVAKYYQYVAIQNLKKNKLSDLNERKNEIVLQLKKEGKESEIQKTLKSIKKDMDYPDALAYLEGEDREHYLHDMKICQEFAVANRAKIANTIIEKMDWCELARFETIHNYIDLESNIVRKGAISAKEGEIVLIPINMRDGSIIAIGKGNDDWNQSAPHGAGRIMSRSEAKKTLTVEDFKKSMNGIYTTTATIETIDEAPMAYKPIEEILENIKDTVDVTHIIKPVYNFKAAE